MDGLLSFNLQRCLHWRNIAIDTIKCYKIKSVIIYASTLFDRRYLRLRTVECVSSCCTWRLRCFGSEITHCNLYARNTKKQELAASNRKATIYFKEMVKSKIQNKKDHFTDHTIIEERFIWIQIKIVPTTFDN